MLGGFREWSYQSQNIKIILLNILRYSRKEKSRLKILHRMRNIKREINGKLRTEMKSPLELY